ncbi:MAG TPA: DUF4231 domain-containing protein, partial [Kamptonema sp.]|nr:DUF4231 domain-containing protein [Kamptonema sp.]
MSSFEINDKDLPGLFQSADRTSAYEQKRHFFTLALYLFLLVLAASIDFADSLESNSTYKVVATLLFLFTLAITIWRKFNKPENVWYNGRAVAESVKTRSWRYMMCAHPYQNDIDDAQVRKVFIEDLKTILKQNESLIKAIGANTSMEEPITTKMSQAREIPLRDRFLLYRDQRITNQAKWYNKKTKDNKRAANMFFWITILLHLVAIILLLFSVGNP